MSHGHSHDNDDTCGGGSCGAGASSLKGSGGPNVLGGVCFVLRLALGGLFLVAAYNKLVGANAPSLFAASIMAFKLDLPAWFVRAATGMTPWIEALCAIALILGLWTRAAAGVIGSLLILFIALIAQAMVRGLELECGCFGKLSPFCPPRIGPCNIVQNGIMLGAAVCITLCPRHVLTVERQTPA